MAFDELLPEKTLETTPDNKREDPELDELKVAAD